MSTMIHNETTTIANTIFQQMGRYGLHGAYNLLGCHEIRFGKDGPLETTKVDEHGCIDWSNGVRLAPNVDAPLVYFFVILQPNDAYSIILWKGSSTLESGKIGRVLTREDGIYCGQLIDVLDSMYVDYIKEYQNGFISL